MIKSKRALSVIITVLMAFAMMPVSIDAVYADDNEGRKAYNEVMRVEEPDTYADQSYEPYGYGEDVPFFMNKQAELLFYQTGPDSSGDINTFFDKLKKASDGDVLSGTKTSAVKAPPDKLKKAYFVKAVGFDPTGTGRDDHIAFIGTYWNGSHVMAYVWTYDTKNRRWSSEFDLGSDNYSTCDWMENRHITEYEGANFLSITAGDYNADGKDTLIAFAAFNGTPNLYELECRNNSIAYYGSNYKGSALCHDYATVFNSSEYTERKMACELDTGDVNGDGVDDLAALTYIGNYVDKELRAEHFRPIVRVSYGNNGGNGFTKRMSFEMATWKWYDGWKWNSQVSPGMSLGDINNDGKDEIVTAGIKCVTKKKTETTTEYANEIDGDLKTFVLIASDNGDNKRQNDDNDILYNGTLNTNAWTKSGFYTDEDIWNKSAVQCAAVNGPGNPEMIFINGTLFSYNSNNNSLSASHTPGYFNNGGDNLSSKASTNMFVQSTAAGNFDGNDKGYEQIAFTVSCKTQSKRSYDYLRGVIGGKNFNSVTGQAGAYYSTSMDYMDDDNSWPGSGKDNASGYISERKGLNCIVVAADNDNDGVLARYKEKALIYSDPEVLCVLQAPPYFKEVKEYLTDTSETAYEISDIFSFDSTKSDSVSYGVGVVAGMESPAMQMEVTAGYALDWTKEFTEGLEDTVTIGWKAKEEDLVIVQRKPVVSYYYQLQTKEGDWSDECMVITVPCEPDIVPMGIGKYNAFATYYNKTLTDSQYLKDYHKLSIPDYMKQYHTLELLNNKWLGHEGDPAGYIKWTNQLFRSDPGYRILQKTPMRMGHNSESVSWGKTTGNSVGVTESMSHGFTYDATIAMGPNVGAASLYVGLSTSLQYMTGSSTTTTQTKEQGISCEINGLKVREMPAELKGDDYNFSFKMARWPSGIKHYVNGKAEDVPVYGYALSGVTTPSEDDQISVDDQLKASEVIELISELPDVTEITTEDESAVRNIRNKYDALSDAAKSLVDVHLIELLESRIELLKKGGIDLTGAAIDLSGSSFTYNGKIQKPDILKINGYTLSENVDYTVKWSDGSSKDAGTYKVTLTGVGLCRGAAEATYKINAATIKNAAVSGLASKTYTGKEITPKPVVKVSGKTLQAGTDYEVKYKNNINAGTATVTISGNGNYSGSINKNFRIDPAQIKEAAVTGLAAKTYTGKAITQAPAVRLGGIGLKSGTDFTLIYKNNTNAGTATVTISGKGNYTGTVSRTFKIGKADNPIRLKGKTASVKYRKLKKKAQKLTAVKVIKFTKKAKGKMKYTLVSAKKGKKSVKKYLKVNSKTGTVTIRKGLRKGTYKVKIKAGAAGNSNYRASAVKKVTITITVK